MVHIANYRHLVPGVSVIKMLSLYEFAPKGRDFATVVRIREGLYYRGYFKRKCMRILPVHRKLSLLERFPYERGVRMERFDCTVLESYLSSWGSIEPYAFKTSLFILWIL